jgi:hypothetical protein
MTYLHHIAACESLRVKPLSYVAWLAIVNTL